MRDVVFVMVVIAFFGLATVYVRACASVVGTQAPADLADLDPATGEREVAA
ncbi:MAG: hypothetical protein ACKVWR_09135 [Acidimicrobiales bacterium]